MLFECSNEIPERLLVRMYQTAHCIFHLLWISATVETRHKSL